eukprot:TRINITY_DN4256_c0_g1_i1.p1 TRINITY_DN4256_c0_g1~~TRINITY_DN4256_c0_g1_i1.p1  ORF type:complete len:917 (-),score=160.82 TRINITY_DN4256_c0_g1_i1:2291-4969(-)
MIAKRDAPHAAATNAPKRARKFFVHIERKPEVQAARLQLPVCMHEQEIIDAIHHNDVVLVSGATGTGKTTQVPQFLVEDGFGDAASPQYKGMIAVTQPRRVAAVTCAKRVAFEMNSKPGTLVGYHIRHDATLAQHTKIKFVTDGVLLREVENDVLLQRYSAIVIDEVHERSLNTDLLLAFLSRTTQLRRKQRSVYGLLKVIVMSATLEIDGVFAGDGALFPNPPIVKVPSRQYPVTIHFARSTKEDYVEEAFRKVSKIHQRLPQGGVLVFLSGRQEVEQLCTKLRDEFGTRKVLIKDSDGHNTGMVVLPFYAMLADSVQRRVFNKFGDDTRKVVVATNVAETSVTVPGISYVVDSGRVKEKVYRTGKSGLLSAYEVRWVSKASAEQRAGRAGRIGAGHCYRLYSSAVFDQQFEEYRAPEIVRVPADSIVLRLRAMGIRHVEKFPFPTRPNTEDLLGAERLLKQLGALQDDGECKGGDDSMLGVTRIGRELARVPLPPRFGRMLVAGREDGAAFPYVCRLCAILTIGSVLERGTDREAKHKVFYNARGEILTELAAVCAAEHHARRLGTTVDLNGMRQFCEQFGLVSRHVEEAVRVSEQLEELFGSSSKALQPADERTETSVIRCFVKGFADRVARRMTRDEGAEAGIGPRRLRAAFMIRGGRTALIENARCIADAGEFIAFAQLIERQVKVKKHVSEHGGTWATTHDDYDEVEGESACDERQQTRERQHGAKELVLRSVCTIDKQWLAEDAAQLCETGHVSRAWFDDKDGGIRWQANVSYANWPLGCVTVRAAAARVAVRATVAMLDAMADALLRELCGEQLARVPSAVRDAARCAMRDALRGQQRVLAFGELSEAALRDARACVARVTGVTPRVTRRLLCATASTAGVQRC